MTDIKPREHFDIPSLRFRVLRDTELAHNKPKVRCWTGSPHVATREVQQGLMTVRWCVLLSMCQDGFVEDPMEELYAPVPRLRPSQGWQVGHSPSDHYRHGPW